MLGRLVDRHWWTLVGLLLLAAYPLRAQQTYVVDDFSPSYFGKIYIQDTAEVFSPGWISIYDKKTKKEVIKVESEELALSLHNGKAQSNTLTDLAQDYCDMF